MSSLVRNILQRLWGPNQQFRIVILGLDAAGKTTILYRLHFGEIVTTIPTIGFNVETCNIQTSSGLLKLTGWDVGGCDKIRPLWRHYFQNVSGSIFVVDSNDRERMDEAKQEFQMLMQHLVRENGTNTPCILLCNKQDLANAMNPSEVENYFKSCIPAGQPVRFYPTTAIAPMKESGLQEAMEWFAGQLINKHDAIQESKPKIDDRPPSGQNASPIPSISERWESYLARAQADNSPDEFLEQFKTYTLPSWDHYTHVRLAYVILTKYGRQKGKDMIFDGIKDYIMNSSRTTGRSFHLTMTYFWIQMVHFGIRSVPSSESEPLGPGNEDFLRFLTVNPHLADGNLWSDYYSKNVIMTPEAKDSVVLPDKKPLPNLVAREAIRGVKQH